MKPRSVLPPVTLLLAAVLNACAPTPPPASPITPTSVAESPGRSAFLPRRSAIMADALGEQLRDEEPGIKDRIESICAELATLDRAALKDSEWAKEWAGTYYEGDGLGENVSIYLAPKAGIAFLDYGCMGLYGGDHGEIVEALPDGLRLKLVFGDAHDSFLSDRIYFVKWGPRRYLVPDHLMLEFVNNYNQGGYSRSVMFGIPRLRQPGDPVRSFESENPPGQPELPPQFARYLTSKSIALKVSKVSDPASAGVTGDVRCRSCQIEFDGGSDQGVFVGMECRYPKEISSTSGTITITAVTPSTCIGHYQVFYAADDADIKFPKVGETILSTNDAEE